MIVWFQKIIIAIISLLMSFGAFLHTKQNELLQPKNTPSAETTQNIETEKESAAEQPSLTQKISPIENTKITKKTEAKINTPTKTTPADTSALPAKTSIKETPGPLIIDVPVSENSILSKEGVLKYTNEARLNNGGLLPLTENEKLNMSSQIKLKDMFINQYFEHISPSGIEVSNVAETVGYQYITIGENLAMGNFKNDSRLVDGWMNSPGHRANILNNRYTEIGIAVGEGIYKGNKIWMAVQTFSKPLSDCPAISKELAKQAEENTTILTAMQTILDAKKQELNNTSQNDPNYNIYVTEFNELVKQYNSLLESTKVIISVYNSQVSIFNTCVNK